MAAIPEERKAIREAKIEISKAELEKYEDRIAKQYARRVRIPGFRPGKAPASIVKQKYRDEIIGQALKDAIKDKVKETFPDAEIISEIRIKSIDQTDDGYEVLVEFEVIPRIEIPDLTAIEAKKKIYKVSDIDVANYIEELRKKLAEYVEVKDRGIQEGDIVIADMEEYDKDGNLVDSSPVRIEYKRDELDERLYDLLEGKKVGDTVELTFDDGSKQVFKITKILEEKLPELDDHFAQLHGYTSLQEMQERIRKQLEEDARRRSEEEFEMEIINKIYEMYPFETPPTFVENAYRNLLQQVQIPQFESEEEKENFQRQLIAYAQQLVARELILDAIAKERNIEVTEEDVKEYLEFIGEKNPEAYIKQAKKRNQYDRLVYLTRLKKAADYLKSTVKAEIVVE